MWDFENDEETEEQLEWVRDFVEQEVMPLDHVIANGYDHADPTRRRLIPPLQAMVKERGLWAGHLPVEHGGAGLGQLKLALVAEVLGRSEWGAIVFGCQAPDSGNSEILARYGTDEQRVRFLQPLIQNEIGSAFAMTEPQGGADPKVFTTTAVLDGDQWVINGEKWFISEAQWASFYIVMCVTEPDAGPYQRCSMVLVPADTPGVEIIRSTGHGDQPRSVGEHAYVRFTDVRVPEDSLLGERGGAFVVAQTRLGGGRIHHAMRTVGKIGLVFEMLCERAVSRFTQGERLADKQLVQAMIADSWIELQQFRLLVLQTAWKIDKYQDYKVVRGDIAAVKSAMPTVLRNITDRAMQLHGALGISNEMPFIRMTVEAGIMGIADGPTEVHKITVAKSVLRDVNPSEDLFPTRHILRLEREAFAKFNSQEI